jgi:putative phosphoribosyl transferase
MTNTTISLSHPADRSVDEQVVRITAASARLEGNLAVPRSKAVRGLILFAHGSGSSRHSPRNRYVAEVLQDAGLATLLIDLLTEAEEVAEQFTRHLRFDVGLLANRLAGAIDWLAEHEETATLPIGLFGASTGAGAALLAAAERPDRVRAVVSRGGRPDLAGPVLPDVKAPTLLIVGERDDQVIELNEEARDQMRAEVRIEIVQDATHLFEEPGTLEEVARLAREWMLRYLR